VTHITTRNDQIVRK